MRWVEFEAVAPALAAVGRRKLQNPEGGEVALLATVDAAGHPAIAPVCPIFTSTGLFLLASAGTPKVAHLRDHPRFALHALVGADDQEFQVRGRTLEVVGADRRAPLAAIPFPHYDEDDPLFELSIEHALAITWPEPGRSAKMVWHA